jgi:2-succinyl-5-enolpyruvyl-6-hydroxy-3-cyclohexene-1-carboxylate synthase
LEEFFETRQNLTARNLAAEFGFDYIMVKNQEELEQAMSSFYTQGIYPKILEIESGSADNATILKQVKAFVNSKLSLSKG